MTPRTSLLFSFLLRPRRILLCLLVVLAPSIFQHLLPNTTTHPIDDDDSTIPRFLYRSPFRDNPDFEYEKRISDALQSIERDELAKNSNTLATETIWQIAKDERQRGDDSRAFERQNRLWKYSVSLFFPPRHCLQNVLFG